MEATDNKKWFVYMGDHHEGPFTPDEILEKVSSQVITTGHYVWTEGMADWLAMTEVPEFSKSLGMTSPVAASAPVEAQAMAPSESEVAAPANYADQGPVAEIGNEPTGEYQAAFEAPASQQESEAPVMAENTAPEKPKAKKMGFGILVGLIGILGGFAFLYLEGYLNPILGKFPKLKMPQAQTTQVQTGQGQASSGSSSLADKLLPYKLMALEKVPALGKFLSPIPNLTDVKAEDLEDLKQAAVAPVSGGVRIGIALSTADLNSPSFYLSGNFPTETRLVVDVIGDGDTLLNYQDFSSVLDVVVKNRFGKSKALAFPDGKPIPKGDYTVQVVDATTRKPIVVKKYFLGGQKDGTYLARLKAFHDKVKERAAFEINETRQFYGLLASQYNNTMANFSKLKKIKNLKLAKKQWDPFSAQWMQVASQVAQSFPKWTPEALAADYFYGKIYMNVQEAAQALSKFHLVQNDFFLGKLDPKTADISLGQAGSAAVSAMSALQASISAAEKLPTSPAGLPKRME